MKQGKLVVIEGIYGTGKYAVTLAEQVREALQQQGQAVYEIDSPDTGRALLMGAQDLDCGWRYGLFRPDFLYEIASRARACSAIRSELRAGKVVLCKNFTLASIAYAALRGHDWYGEELDSLEARARGRNFGGEVIPDFTIYLELAPELALKKLGSENDGLFTLEDLQRQAACYETEIAKLPAVQAGSIDATYPPEMVTAAALAMIRNIL